MITPDNQLDAANFDTFKKLVEKNAPEDGPHETKVGRFYTYRASVPERRCPTVYEPVILIAAQGKKHCYINGKIFDYGAGKIMTLFLPMPLESELIDVSPEKPFLCAIVGIDLARLANIVLKMDSVTPMITHPEATNTSGIFSAPLQEDLLDPVLRLLKCLDNPRDAVMLGESIIDEIYYRILSSEQGGALISLLQQRGQIQRISKAVEYIHDNLDQVVSVEVLADLVNMSSSGFHKSFKEVMHLSPLQYAKSMKLFKAQTLIKEGKNVSEAGYMVGYNSPAQFSREFKRHFGVLPSAI